MKKFKKSLCALAVLISISGISSTAFADDSSNVQTTVPTPDTAIKATNDTSKSTTDAKLDQKEPKKSDREIEKEKLENLDYSNYNQEAVLRKVAVLQSMLQLKKLQQDILDVDKTDDDSSNNQQQNGMSSNTTNQQPVAQTPAQQTATSLVTPTVDPAPVIKATAVYSLGNTSYAEISFNGNKTVVKSGEVLPNGYKVVSLNPLGITLQKGKTRMSLPIVGDTTSSDNGQQNVSNQTQPATTMPTNFQMSAPRNR